MLWLYTSIIIALIMACIVIGYLIVVVVRFAKDSDPIQNSSRSFSDTDDFCGWYDEGPVIPNVINEGE